MDEEVSTRLVSRRWNDAPPDAFSVRWSGYLIVGRAGLYRFATTSDDGSSLSLDGRPVVNNGGRHGSSTRAGQIRLDAGPHFVLLEYFQSGGPYAMDWSWAPAGPDDAPLAPVPRWMLSPNRLTYARALAARLVGGFRLLASITWAVIGCALIAGYPRPWISRFNQEHVSTPFVMTPGSVGASLAVFLVLTVVETWPLATNPARLSRNDNGDTVLNEWILAWVAHQAPQAPLHLYEANIFYPEQDTLAYSEALLLQGAFGAPLRWLGASPVLTYNLVLLAGFALTGWAMCLVVAHWTHDWVAGLTAGVLLAFNAFTLTNMPHIQFEHVEFLPLALLALDALLRHPRLHHALGLAAWFSLQSLASFYLLVFTAVALVAATLVRPEAWWRRRFLPVASYLAFAGALAGLALLPYLLPYWHAYHDRGMVRSLDAVMIASWRDYLTTPGRLDYVWSERWFWTTGLFPGIAALVLAGIAIVKGVAITDPRPRMCLAFGLCGIVLSFGPSVPGYSVLYRLTPALGAIRAASRFGYLALVAVAVLAAYGVVEVRSHLPAHGRWRPALSLLILAAVTAESVAIPVSYAQFEGVPSIYGRVRNLPAAVVVELPIPPAVWLNAPFMLNSTRHWKPMLNGYSGFVPASYERNYDALRDFPSPGSITRLESDGVTHAFVHLDRLNADALDELQRTPALDRLAIEGAIALYGVARADGSRR